MSLIYVWLLAGAAMIALEAFAVPGIGLLFAGLGALTTALILKLGGNAELGLAAQFAWWFGLTSAWAALLWKPLKNFRMQKRGTAHVANNNALGDVAKVGKGGLTRGEIGIVHWSGSIMNAMIDTTATVDTIPEGALVEIRGVEGTLLKVINKRH